MYEPLWSPLSCSNSLHVANRDFMTAGNMVTWAKPDIRLNPTHLSYFRSGYKYRTSILTTRVSQEKGKLTAPWQSFSQACLTDKTGVFEQWFFHHVYKLMMTGEDAGVSGGNHRRRTRSWWVTADRMLCPGKHIAEVRLCLGMNSKCWAELITRESDGDDRGHCCHPSPSETSLTPPSITWHLDMIWIEIARRLTMVDNFIGNAISGTNVLD